MTNESNNSNCSFDTGNDVLEMRIGKTTFLVSVKPSDTAENPIESVFRSICIHDALNAFSGNEAEKEETLGKNRKTS